MVLFLVAKKRFASTMSDLKAEKCKSLVTRPCVPSLSHFVAALVKKRVTEPIDGAV